MLKGLNNVNLGFPIEKNIIFINIDTKEVGGDGCGGGWGNAPIPKLNQMYTFSLAQLSHLMGLSLQKLSQEGTRIIF